MINKVLGNNTEQECLKLLQKVGYWNHLFSYKANGQPCDIVALKNDVSYLIDVKHCKKNIFYFNNIQDNQHTCFRYAMYNCGVKKCGFAIYFEEKQDFYWLPYEQIDLKNKGVKAEELRRFEDEINHW